MKNIKIRVGKTRIVIILESYVFKVVRLRFFDFTYKLIMLYYHKIKFNNEIAYQRLHRSSRTQLFKDMFVECFLANYRECKLWNNPLIEKERYVPTLCTIFYIINVQERAHTKDNIHKLLSRAHSRQCGQKFTKSELDYPDNLSKNGRILDYGSINTTT